MRAYETDELENASTEEIDSAKDLMLGEVELLAFRHSEEFVFRDAIVLVVGFVETRASLELLYQRLRLFLPELVVVFVF